MVTDLRPSGNQSPLELFENPHEERHIGTLLEDVTRRYGRGSIGLGHPGIECGLDWSMKRDMLSSPATPPTGTNSPSSKPPDPPHSPARPHHERKPHDHDSRSPTRTHDVQVRTDPAGKPLAVRHDGRIWILDPATDYQHRFTRDAWWDTRRGKGLEGECRAAQY